MIKASNNIVSPSLIAKELQAGCSGLVTLSVAGDDESEKQDVLTLIEQIGFDAIHGGPLAESWRQQPAESAYCRDLDKDACERR